MRPWFVGLVLAAVGCNDHRLGFFGDEEGTGAETTSGPEPTTVSPTTVSPTVPTTDPTSGPGTITITSEPTTDPTTDPTGDTEGMGCGEVLLPPIAPVSVSGDNSGQADRFMAPCLPDLGFVSPDAVWLWTAPFDGVFEFNTNGSGLDTVLTVLDGACGGPSLGCNDDTEMLWSSVTTKLAAGTPVTIVVEGLSGQTGPIELSIRDAEVLPPPSCAVIELGSDLGAINGSTLDASNATGSACGGSGSPEVVFRWQAPFPGVFVFRTFGSDYDPLMYIRRGDCDGEELGCNDDFDDLEPQLQLQLSPDDGPVFVFVDGALASSGSFALEIAEL